MKTFAAIDVGSFELAMKIFEISHATGIREVDSIRCSLDLGSETYVSGKMSCEKINELCDKLCDFSKIMSSYKVDDYRAYGTSALRETKNTAIVVDQIEQRTGIRIGVLSNSEQRFLDYKSVASKGGEFEKIIEKKTAIVDVGGGSIQISLFDKDTLVTTQNMKVGVLRLQEAMRVLNASSENFEDLVEEYISSQLEVFKKLYLDEINVPNIIIVDDYISAIVDKKIVGDEHRFMSISEVSKILMEVKSMGTSEIAHVMDIPEENVQPTFISEILVSSICHMMNAEVIWVPGVTLSDGMAYEYAENKKLVTLKHNFEEDIIACAKNISARYMGSRKRSETIEKIALEIFDCMKKVHGLGRRQRLLLRISAILHDCGKYISMVNLGECSYNIIISTEIIGLSHMEREIVANVVTPNHSEFEYYEELGRKLTISREDYLTIAKLTAMLRLANGLDRSHKQKFGDMKVQIRGNILECSVSADEDITLEKGMLSARSSFFEEVFNVHPVIKQIKRV